MLDMKCQKSVLIFIFSTLGHVPGTISYSRFMNVPFKHLPGILPGMFGRRIWRMKANPWREIINSGIIPDHEAEKAGLCGPAIGGKGHITFRGKEEIEMQ